jgi:hypothetical protein
MELETKNLEIFENALFTRLSEAAIDKAKPSEINKFLDIICTDWDLNIKNQKHYDIALTILKNSINKN